MAALSKLPTEILHMIADFLTIGTGLEDIVVNQKVLASLTRVNTRLRDVFDPILWKTNAVFSAPGDPSDPSDPAGPNSRPYPKSIVFWAAGKNRIDILEKAFKYNLALGMTNTDGPLNHAARLGQDAAVCWLLDHGVPTDPKNSREISSGHHYKARETVPCFHSPLCAAISMRRESTALILLSRGANIWFSQYAPDGEFQEAAIHCATYYSLAAVVKHLVLAMGIHVDELDSNLETPLNHAMKQNDNESMIKTLLELGADINEEQGSELPIITAIKCRNFTNAMAFLDARPRVNISNTGLGSMSPLAACALYVRGSVCLSGDEPILSKQRQLFRKLIIGGADVEKCTGALQVKPIDLIWNPVEIIEIAMKGAISVAAGARLDVPSKVSSDTPLMEAILSGSMGSQPILSALLCSADRQSFRDGYLDELFQYFLEECLYGPAKVLMNYGAPSQGAKETVYNWANEIAGGFPDAFSYQVLSFCLDFQFSNEEIENLFTSALHSMNEECCHLLMDRGVLSFSEGPKPWLHLAASKGSFSLVRRLCRAGMDINALNDDFETPMMMALRPRHVTIADLLFDLGADPFYPRPDTECRQSQDLPTEITSPFEYAVRHSYHGHARRWWRDSPPELRPTEESYISSVISTGEDCAELIDTLRRFIRSSSKDTGVQSSRCQIMEDAEEQTRFKAKMSSVQEQLVDALGDGVLDADCGWTQDYVDM